MKVFTLNMPDAYAERLKALAAARGRSEEQCLLDFIAACQPGGSGWQHPEAPPKVRKDPPA